MIARERIHKILEEYEEPKIATICSHSALQIFHGARREGIKTIGISIPRKLEVYRSFRLAKPDELICMKEFSDLPDVVGELVEKNAILIPHGSLIEYVKNLEELEIPIFGNRRVLMWERSREKMFEWMREAKLRVPKIFKPEEIDRPCLVKFGGAKGGKGYIVVSSYEDFLAKTKGKSTEGAMIQEYIVGTRFYPHYFYTPLSKDAYPASKGSIELLSIDRRIETNVEDIHRAMSAGVIVEPSFGVVGNAPVAVRESLLPEMMEMGRRVVEAADRLMGGIPGPFCIEMICDEDFRFYVFEISARIVAGTNLFPDGSPYSVYLFDEPMSTGRRIAREIKNAMEMGKLKEIVY